MNENVPLFHIGQTVYAKQPKTINVDHLNYRGGSGIVTAVEERDKKWFYQVNWYGAISNPQSEWYVEMVLCARDPYARQIGTIKLHKKVTKPDVVVSPKLVAAAKERLKRRRRGNASSE